MHLIKPKIGLGDSMLGMPQKQSSLQNDDIYGSKPRSFGMQVPRGQDGAQQQVNRYVIEGGNSRSASLPQTSGFTKNYAVFFGVDKSNISQEISQQAKDFAAAQQNNQGKQSTIGNLKRLNHKNASSGENNSYRINTGLRNDPDFQVNMNKFFGQNPNEDSQYKKNYKNFYNNGSTTFNFKNNLSQTANNIIKDQTKKGPNPQAKVDPTDPYYQRDVKRFFGLPPSTHQKRELAPVQEQSQPMIPSQRKVLDEAFEKNKKAFFAAYTPDPQAQKNKAKNNSTQFDQYLNKSKNEAVGTRRIDSSSSSFVANKNKFFGVQQETSNSFQRNAKAFFGDKSVDNINSKGNQPSNAGMLIQRPTDYTVFSYSKNPQKSITKDTYSSPQGFNYNIITGALMKKE